MKNILLLSMVILMACSESKKTVSVQGSNATQFLSESGTNGYKRVLTQRMFDFPTDQSSHDDYQNEWWYFTGNLETTEERHFGFELTFFRFGLDSTPTPRQSQWGASQVWMGHFAVTDTEGEKFIAVERFSRQALNLAGSQMDPFRIWLEDWSILGNGQNISPLILNASSDRITLDLTLETQKPPVSHGNGGVDEKGPEEGNASYYYSLTNLNATGTLRVDDTSFDVTGLAWMDREWGTSSLSPDIAGWDWFGLQLSDGREIMYYRLRTNDLQSSPYSGGSIVLHNGGRISLSMNDVVLEPLQYWTSPETSATYPISWKMSIPREGIELTIQPYLNEQELNLTVRYWEGAVQVNGNQAGRTLTGNGYAELTGY